MIIATEKVFIQPKIQGRVGKNRRYRLLEDYCFEWQENGRTYRRTVFAKDDETDLASVPDEAAALGFEQAGPSDGAAVGHDDAYNRLGRKDGKGWAAGSFQVFVPGVAGPNVPAKLGGDWVDCQEPFPRNRADKLYRRMCIAGGMPAWKANVEYLALRFGAINPANKISWYFS